MRILRDRDACFRNRRGINRLGGKDTDNERLNRSGGNQFMTARLRSLLVMMARRLRRAVRRRRAGGCALDAADD